MLLTAIVKRHSIHLLCVEIDINCYVANKLINSTYISFLICGNEPIHSHSDEYRKLSKTRTN